MERRPNLTVIPGSNVDPLEKLDLKHVLEEVDVMEAIEIFRRIKRMKQGSANSVLKVVPTAPLCDKLPKTDS